MMPQIVLINVLTHLPLPVLNSDDVMHGRKFHLTVGGDNKYKISHEQFLKGTQIIQSNYTYKDMSPQ